MDVGLGHGHAPWLTRRGGSDTPTPSKHTTSNMCLTDWGRGVGFPSSTLALSPPKHQVQRGSQPP